MSRRKTIERARELRRAMTPAEIRLWRAVRNLGLADLKFRRQHPLHGHIVDYYCSRYSLVVELDGAIHLDPQQREYDSLRDEVLRSHGLTVLRFTNSDVETELLRVLAEIGAAVRESACRRRADPALTTDAEAALPEPSEETHASSGTTEPCPPRKSPLSTSCVERGRG